MLKSLIENNITIKATALSASSGMISVWVFDMSDKTLGLGVIGFLIAIFSFIHDYANTKEEITHLQIVGEMGKYILFGTIAFPSAYDLASHYIEEQTILVAVGVFASFFIVSFLDVFVKELKKIVPNLFERFKK